MYCIPDVPHLLKLARNHCVFSKGFLVPSNINSDGTELFKLGHQDFVNILRENGWKGPMMGLGKMGDDDLRTNFRFSPAHLKAHTGNQKQNVRMAAQTISHTNAKAFLQMAKSDDPIYEPSHAQALHDTVKLFNDW